MLPEAKIFAQYLDAKVDDEALLIKYTKAIEKLKLSLSEKEASVLRYLIKMPFLLPFADGAWAFLNPKNGIRKRIMVMSAFIETEPQFVQLFLNEKDVSFSVFKMLFRGSVAVLRGIIGVFLILVLGWK
ncbi:hypothetical protein EGI24_16120 [Lacihabitans sp. CS3-21]|nr:hypothetical protein [Lacihabitans sp. CS3-21]